MADYDSSTGAKKKVRVVKRDVGADRATITYSAEHNIS
jgi:hypothetical protein